MHRDNHHPSTQHTSQPANRPVGRRRRRAERPDQEVAHQQHELLVGLFRELFQTERSAERHPMREAERLGDTPPAQALRAVSWHAASVLRELPALAMSANLPDSTAGRTLGELFSLIRDNVADRFIDAERSYRATLLGLRHGVDLARMIQRVADASGQVEIGGFCTRWLAAREPLVHDVEQALSWFAANPDVALHEATWRPHLPSLSHLPHLPWRKRAPSA